MDLGALLNPRTVAIVGASDENRTARDVHSNLQRSLADGFRGRIHAVNPSREIALGQRCFANLNDIPGPVDLALLVGPLEEAEERFEDCVAKAVKAAWILSGTVQPSDGDPASEARRRRLGDRAREAGIFLGGPAALGFLNVPRVLYALGMPAPAIDPGPIGLVFQSGELLLTVLRALAARAIGVCCAVASGEEAALQATDYMRCMLDQDEVKVVGAFLERIRSPRSFVEMCDHATRIGKPVVVLKLGRHEPRPSSGEVSSALFRQKGVVQVSTLDELVETCNFFGYHTVPQGDRVAAVAVSAGACGILGEVAREAGIRLEEPSADAQALLAAELPGVPRPFNPLDLTGEYEGRTDRFIKATKILVEAGYDTIIYGAPAPRSAEPPFDGVLERLRAFRDLGAATGRTMVPLQMVSEGLTPYGQALAAQEDVRFVQGTATGMSAIAGAMRWGAFRREYLDWNEASEPHVLFPFDARKRGLDLLEGLPDGALDEAVSRQLLAMYGVPLVPAAAAETADAAVEVARQLGYPVAVKALCTGMPNRSAAGAVALELAGDVAVRVAFDQVVDAAERAGARDVRGAIVSKMVRGIVPVRCGAFGDTLWGPTVFVGMGGSPVEADAERALRVCPTGRRELRAMLKETRVSRLLDGWGGRPPADRNALVDLLERLALLMQDLADRVGAIELNPVGVFPAGGGCIALDATVTKSTARA